MTDPPKLDTPEAVLEWARFSDATESLLGRPVSPADTPTAAYIAECVRAREWCRQQGLDELLRDEANGPSPSPLHLPSHLRGG